MLSSQACDRHRTNIKHPFTTKLQLNSKHAQVMPAKDSAAVVVARFLKSNNYTEVRLPHGQHRPAS
jgi:hypothetical protein